MKGDWKFIGIGLEVDGRILMMGSHTLMESGDKAESNCEWVWVHAIDIIEWEATNFSSGGKRLAATKIDYRCDPEAALALWLYSGSEHK